MNRSGFILVGILALTLSAAIGATLWIFSVDAQWSPLIESRIRSRQVAGSITVKAQNTRGDWQWVGSLNNGRLEERQAITLAETPPQLVQAIVQIEDPRFHSHEGFDMMGILRALTRNILSLRYAQGGSTITQQLVKNVFLTNEKTLKRKFTELILAALVEKRFAKDAILEAYINEVYMGQEGPIAVHGIARASQYYFSKKLNDLTLHEMALLVAMIKGPGFFDPWRHPERTKNRRDFVLKLLADANLILEEEQETAQAAPLPPRNLTGRSTRASYLLDLTRNNLISTQGESAVVEGGLEVELSINTDLQRRAEDSLRNVGKDWPLDLQALIIAVDPLTCQIKAYVGGRNYSMTQYDRITKSLRSIGSLMKPLVVPYFIENKLYSLGSALEDRALEWNYDSNRGTWKPENYDRKFREKISLRQTLEDSINVPIIRMFFEQEPSGLIASLLSPVEKLGLNVPQNRALPSAILGSIEQKPWDVALAYTRLARIALGMSPTAGCENLSYVLGVHQFPLRKTPSPSLSSAKSQSPSGAAAEVPTDNQILAAQQVISAMQGAMRRGTSAFLSRSLEPEHNWGGKTGTSSDKKDSWFAAVSPHLVVISWVGADTATETKYTGASAAAPLASGLIVESELIARQNPSTKDWIKNDQLDWLPYDIKNLCFLPELEAMAFRDLNPPPTKMVPPVEISAFRGRELRYELRIREGDPSTICTPL
jgi:penicillin-binding protein 1B